MIIMYEFDITEDRLLRIQFQNLELDVQSNLYEQED